MPRIQVVAVLAIPVVLVLPGQATAQCPGGDKWISNTCVTITATGCCNDADHVRYCYNGVLCERYCSSDWCGWSSSTYTCTISQTSDPTGTFPRKCPSDCTGKDCGDDGCGGSCGTCTATYQWECRQGICVCTPDCTGRECGSDGCSGSCGGCPPGKICSRNQCIDKPCTPACFERECGSDNCGGLCGTCPQGEDCNEYNGQCVGAECTPACTNRQCGDDGCGGSCGSCGEGLYCDDSSRCRAGTPPDPGPGEDVPANPADRGGTADQEDRGSVTPPVTCPSGTVLRYGACVPVETGGGKSGCAMSGRSSGTPPPVLLVVPLAVLAAARRRRRA